MSYSCSPNTSEAEHKWVNYRSTNIAVALLSATVAVTILDATKSFQIMFAFTFRLTSVIHERASSLGHTGESNRLEGSSAVCYCNTTGAIFGKASGARCLRFYRR